jgi:CRP/FNR family cyclic AMP-dependent transcriptional regulator
MSIQQIDVFTLLRDHPFVKNLGDDTVRELARISTIVRFSQGQRIFDEGEVHRKLYLIIYGRIALYFHIPGKGEFRFETIGSGEVLGWSSLVEPFKKTSGSIAIENTLAVAMDSEKLQRIMEGDPALGYELYRRIIKVVADRLRATRIRLIDIYGEGTKT